MQKVKIGVLGTGLMGAPIAERFLKFGYETFVYNRTFEKAKRLEAVGAKAFEKPVEVIRKADYLIVMLSDFNAIRATLLNGSEVELKGKTLIQMSTIAVRESRELGEIVKANGGRYLEAPVLGSIPQIKEGKLIIMAAGSQELFEEVKPLLQVVGEKLTFVGETGKAAAMKLALNQLIASLTAAFSTSLGLVRKYGINVDLFMDVLRESALYSPTFDKKLPRMLKRNFENPNFPLKHLLKDVNLILDECNETGVKTDILEGVKKIVERGLQMGLDEKDYSSLYMAVDRNG